MMKLSNESQLQGYTLLYGKYDTQDHIGIRQNLFVSNDFKLTKPVLDYRKDLMKSKDTGIIKLRDKLFTDDRDIVYALIAALSEEDLTLQEFKERLDNGGYSNSNEPRQPVQSTSFTPKEEDNKDTIEVTPTEVEDIKLDNDLWGGDIFGTTNEQPAQEEVVAAAEIEVLQEEFPTINPITDMLNVDFPMVEEVNGGSKKGTEYINELFVESEKLGKPLPNLVEDKLDTLLDLLTENSINTEDIVRVLEDLVNMPVSPTEERVEDTKVEEKLVDIECNLIMMEERILSAFKNVEPIKEQKILEVVKPISGVERELIDGYEMPAPLIKYLGGEQIGKINQGKIVECGLELLPGVESIVNGSSAGLFEFISKYFPFIFVEYKNSIQDKIK